MLEVIYIAAIIAGVMHAIFGPDHYLPFIVIAKAQGWGQAKTLALTFLAGIAHVLSTVILGIVGIFLSINIAKIEWIQALCGEFAAWGFILFGMVYCILGLRKALRTHLEEGSCAITARKLTLRILFCMLLLGPCEPLIPLMMFAKAKGSTMLVWPVAGVFAASTILTMFGIVFAGIFALRNLRANFLQKYANALAGGVIAICGVAVKFLAL